MPDDDHHTDEPLEHEDEEIAAEITDDVESSCPSVRILPGWSLPDGDGAGSDRSNDELGDHGPRDTPFRGLLESRGLP